MGQSHDFENIFMKNPNRSHRGLDYAFFPENQIPNCANRGIGIILLLQIFGQSFDKPSHSDTCIHSSTNTQACRKRGGRGHVPPVLGRSVNPISTRGWGAHYAHHITMCPSGFSDHATALIQICCA